MQVFKTTTANLERQEIDSTDMLNLEVKIGHRVYQLSEREGALRVSVEGQLVAMPGGANMIILSAIEASKAVQTTVEQQYEELFHEATKAAKEAGWGAPQTHDDLMAALQTMAVPTDNY